MAYTVFVDLENGREPSCHLYKTYDEALANAKAGIEWGGHAHIVNVQNNEIMWDSRDDEPLKRVLEKTDGEYAEITEGANHGKDPNKPSVYFDVAGTLANYQPDYGLPKEEMFNGHYPSTLPPYVGMVLLAEELHNRGIDVNTISTADRREARDEYNWVRNYLPFVPQDNIHICPINADKNDFVKGNSEISKLIDDYNKPLAEWRGGVSKARTAENLSQKGLDGAPEINLIEIEELLKDNGLQKNITVTKEQAIEPREYSAVGFAEINNSFTDIAKMADEIKPTEIKGWLGDGELAVEETVVRNPSLNSWASIKAAIAKMPTEVREAVKQAVAKEADRIENDLKALNNDRLYMDYKRAWIKENITKEVQQQTYELFTFVKTGAPADAPSLNFDAYVEMFGWADGSSYMPRDLFNREYAPLWSIAEQTETILFNRGGYNETPKPRWIGANAEKTAEYIRRDLENGDYQKVLDYLDNKMDEISNANDEYTKEDLALANSISHNIKQMFGLEERDLQTIAREISRFLSDTSRGAAMGTPDKVGLWTEGTPSYIHNTLCTNPQALIAYLDTSAEMVADTDSLALTLARLKEDIAAIPAIPINDNRDIAAQIEEYMFESGIYQRTDTMFLPNFIDLNSREENLIHIEEALGNEDKEELLKFVKTVYTENEETLKDDTLSAERAAVLGSTLALGATIYAAAFAVDAAKAAEMLMSKELTSSLTNSNVAKPKSYMELGG